MPEQARVDDLDVFRIFRGAVLKFAQTANQALLNADAQGTRVLTWLETEQTSYWQGQLRKRTEAVSRAQEALRAKKLFRDASGRIPNAAEEEKNLAKCKAAVLQAQEKIALIRKAIPRLQKEIEAYRGGVSQLAGTLSAEIPKAVATLDALAGRMEEYVQLAAPGPGGAGGGAGGEDFASAPPAVEPMARPEAPGPQSGGETAGPATTIESSPVTGEGTQTAGEAAGKDVAAAGAKGDVKEARTEEAGAAAGSPKEGDHVAGGK